jgi:hypothetical protein
VAERGTSDPTAKKTKGFLGIDRCRSPGIDRKNFQKELTEIPP